MWINSGADVASATSQCTKVNSLSEFQPRYQRKIWKCGNRLLDWGKIRYSLRVLGSIWAISISNIIQHQRMTVHESWLVQFPQSALFIVVSVDKNHDVMMLEVLSNVLYQNWHGHFNVYDKYESYSSYWRHRRWNNCIIIQINHFFSSWQTMRKLLMKTANVASYQSVPHDNASYWSLSNISMLHIA